MTVRLEFVQANATGMPMCESNVLTRWPRAVVDRALALRSAGLTFSAISQALGVPIPTVFDWTSGRRRRPPDRIIVKRVKESGSFVTNHQRAITASVDKSRSVCVSVDVGEHANAGDADKFTVKGVK